MTCCRPPSRRQSSNPAPSALVPPPLSPTKSQPGSQSPSAMWRCGTACGSMRPIPADSSSYLYTDSKGILRYRPPGAGQAAEMSWSPFHAGYSAGIDSIERNKHRIAELDWSADGQRFSFRIDTPPGLDNSAAGVWHWQPQTDPVHGATFQLIRDCAHDGYRPCHFVNCQQRRALENHRNAVVASRGRQSHAADPAAARRGTQGAGAG